MSTLTLTQEMVNCFSQLSDEEQKSVLQMLKAFLHNRKQAFNAQELEQYNQELEQADAAIDGGDFVSHEEVMKRYFKP